ncbi:NAD(P)H-dependent oxidoreductase subunit E [Pseudoroseomonas deserti]|uniref:NAD(P)H-dependent oxidoreductase subunit E n=1 Tax=Teichococcus deserti TaxID=1817963 RepID=A0A1V2H651_9PROT|nr:NAD(P)H-dependent oxidoreductase subunit E [Pseudoroseomonas deserti]ONG57231.1 NAD(P)H-dependent oxidoreductase subunit E [Pseudoroseomonas deserti]
MSAPHSHSHPAHTHEEPASFAFDAESEAQIARILARYPEGKQASGVIPLLYVAQKQMGRLTGSAWTPRIAMDTIAERLGMAPIRVYEVATFYFMFNTKPIGRFHLQVCGTTPCWLRGSDEVLRACKEHGHLKGYGDTSEDGLFTMTEVECLGGCVNAPILQVDDDYYEDMDYETTVTLLEALKRGERPTPGSMKGRQGSAPIGGPETVLDIPMVDAGKE